MQYKIAVIPGDGIGPEITDEASKVLESIGKRFGHSFILETVTAGATALEKGLPQEACRFVKRRKP